MKKRTVILLASCMMLLGAGIGGSLAWLLTETPEVTNTFTTSNIDITLDEAPLNDDGMTLNHEAARVQGESDYKMVPGMTLEKDPTVTVKGGSEDCWVFIKVVESENLDDYIYYTIDNNNWEPLEDESGNEISGVYYSKSAVTDIESDRRIKVLLENQVQVKETVTKAMMDALEPEEAEKPTLTFQAYAAQLYKNNTETFSAIEAWKHVESLNTSGSTPEESESESEAVSE